MPAKRILLILWMYKALDTEAPPSRFLNLFSYLQGVFPESYVIMQENEKNPLQNEKIREIRPFIPIHGRFRLIRGIILRLQMLLATTSLVIRKKIDCVIMRGEDTILVLPLLKLLGIFIIYDFHGLKSMELLHERRRLRAWMVGILESILLGSSDKILVISKGIIPQIRRYEEKCMYLPNGVDITGIKRSTRDCGISLPPGKRIIGFLGNWEQCMKIEDICEAPRYLQDTVAVIVGRGYMADVIEAKYREDSGVIFTGRIERECAYTLLKKFDICIIPYDKNAFMSQIENFFSNRKIFEYLAAGKPMILSGIPGIPDFLKEKINYLSYDSGNPKDLGEKIRYLSLHPDLSMQMSGNNSGLAEEFSWTRLIESSGLCEMIGSASR
jgi:glycosyltransferase involved in cell wall biosynthesis